MNASPRYAIYIAPESSSALWHFGSAILGYDASTGVNIPHLALENILEEELQTLTIDPRVYGFHATIKAPMRLADGVNEAEFYTALTDFCRTQRAFDIALELTTLTDSAGTGFFTCLTPQPACPPLMALERAVVVTFDALRAPLSAEERARRKPEHLTPQQREYFEAYGYPYILDLFRPHFTLTSAYMRQDNKPDPAPAIAKAFDAQVGEAKMRCDALVIFKQQAAGERFKIVKRFRFGGSE